LVCVVGRSEDNHLLSQADIGRLGVHYRFLSGYVHPVAHHQRSLYGADYIDELPRYDHYASELVLLYCVRLAALEIRNFVDAMEPRTDVNLAAPERVEQLLALADEAAEHFWFLGVAPHPWDIFEAGNQRAFKGFTDGQWGEPGDDIDPEDVPYPGNPLTRLVCLHRSVNEMTAGRSYLSPWARSDGRFR
jgi:hypothetical protein